MVGGLAKEAVPTRKYLGPKNHLLLLLNGAKCALAHARVFDRRKVLAVHTLGFVERILPNVAEFTPC